MRYTKEQEQVIIDKITNNPGNLQKAFEEAAEVLGRTKAAIQTKYYNKHNGLKYTKKIFFTVSEDNLNINTKNVVGNSTTVLRPRKSAWSKICDIFKNFLK